MLKINNLGIYFKKTKSEQKIKTDRKAKINIGQK